MIRYLPTAFTKWKRFDKMQPLNKTDNHLFKIQINAFYSKIRNLFHEMLSSEELLKASRFSRVHDRHRYIATRYAIREILEYFLKEKASSIIFHQTHNKKPTVSGVAFNISYSKNYILVAISMDNIGVDIEFIDERFDFNSIVTNCFTKNEQLSIAESGQKLGSFYTIWTRKEAILKASGEGLIDNLSEVDCLPMIITRNKLNYSCLTSSIDGKYIYSLAVLSRKSINYWNYK